MFRRNNQNVTRTVLFACGLGMATSAVSASPIITVKARKNAVLTDLIAYKLNPFQIHTFLEPGNAADDVTYDEGQSRIYVAPFNPDFVFTSMMEGNSEVEAKGVFTTGDNTGNKLAFAMSADTGSVLGVVVDYNIAPDDPIVDTQVWFTDGFNPDYPGWFIGSDIDFGTGDISNPFTGLVDVSESSFEVSPAPASLALLGLAGITACRRRRA